MINCFLVFFFFFFKQKTAYEMRISDWSSDVCSSDLGRKDLFSICSMPIAWRLSGVRAASQHYIARSMTVTPFVDFGSRSKSSPSRRGLALPKPVIHSSLSCGVVRSHLSEESRAARGRTQEDRTSVGEGKSASERGD